MTNRDPIDAALDEVWLTLDELCALGGTHPQWVRLHVEEGLIAARRGGDQGWRFDAVALARVRRLQRIERDFGAAPELAALVADLEDEFARLRARLARAGL